MHAICLAAAGVMAVDFGWQPRQDGGVECVIQIEPELIEALEQGRVVINEIPPHLKNVRSFRVQVGRGELPRIDPPAEEAPVGRPADPPAIGRDPRTQPGDVGGPRGSPTLDDRFHDGRLNPTRPGETSPPPLDPRVVRGTDPSPWPNPAQPRAPLNPPQFDSTPQGPPDRWATRQDPRMVPDPNLAADPRLATDPHGGDPRLTDPRLATDPRGTAPGRFDPRHTATGQDPAGYPMPANPAATPPFDPRFASPQPNYPPAQPSQPVHYAPRPNLVEPGPRYAERPGPAANPDGSSGASRVGSQKIPVEEPATAAGPPSAEPSQSPPGEKSGSQPMEASLSAVSSGVSSSAPFINLLIALFMSVGGNAYFGLSWWGTHNRYLSLVDQMRSAGVRPRNA